MKENNKKRWYSNWWVYLLLGLLIGGAIADGVARNDMYLCSKRCVSDLKFYCMDYWLYGEDILQEDYEHCYSELEECVNNC